jgi:RNA polymerase sigma factor (sigma-70 family)
MNPGGIMADLGNVQNGAAAFGTTHWTNVLVAARPDSNEGREAFARLYQDYWRPLHAYICRRGYSPAEAEDISQDFFVRLISKQALAGLRRDGGRFRSYLLSAINNFLANEWDRRSAQKRGAGQRPLSLDVEQNELHGVLAAADRETPESLFEKRWAFAVLEQVTTRLRAEYFEEGKGELFEQFRVYLQGDRAGPSYAAVAAQRGMSEGAVAVAVHRMRQRYGQILRDEVMRTVGSPDEVDAELQYLMEVVGR